MHRQPTGLTLPILIGLLAAVFLGGCTQPVRQAAPEEAWPEIDKEVQDCTAISGSYRSHARHHRDTGQPDVPLLAYTLLPATAELSAADRITLEVSAEKVSVSAFQGKTPLQSHTYAATDRTFECIAGSLEFHPALKPAATQVAENPGIPWETIRLRRTVSGSLLLQEADGLAGLAFMLFPIYFTSEHWYQFEPIE
jgi:hypothetical protein